MPAPSAILRKIILLVLVFTPAMPAPQPSLAARFCVVSTADSIPDELFESAEGLARRLGVSRSELYAKVLRDYLREHRGEGITERLDEVYGGEEEGDLDPVVAKLQGRSLSKDEW